MKTQAKQALQEKRLNQNKAELKNQKNDYKSTKVLSAIDKKKLVLKKRREKREGKIPKTFQQTICYQEMYKGDICKVTERFYTKTIQFYDINYKLAQNEDKTTIFENYCDFLNYFDSSISVQLSFINSHANVVELIYQAKMIISMILD